jgi:DNA-binding response OmpR family regulator
LILTIHKAAIHFDAKFEVRMKLLLLVDDEATVCVELQRTLELFGYKVEIAHSFESALQWCSKSRFDAILVEFNLRSECRTSPRAGNGIDLVRKMRALNVAMPILMLTAMEGELYETVSFDAGADDFITKTGTFSGVISRLRAHIQRNERPTSTHSEK